ncbi:hypothetical protein [Priestia koreensis]|uniref:Uncharacterized protein n=1 Tax=Priestia koreensis TaxID=284581 RepID=A0A0M0L5S9_9BACI|nr:hypothetical protein [Priestia koreensis]KOO46399.1 hypothetical protein AMD01_11225 [Priestia koreensis]
MYGKFVSSNGVMFIEKNEVEKVIKFTQPLSVFSIGVSEDVLMYLNDDPNGIYVCGNSGASPFDNHFKDIPVWKIGIKRYSKFTGSLITTTDNKTNPVMYSYYGVY